jgi:glycosyltransferase involved in cell wall biosynthesis
MIARTGLWPDAQPTLPITAAVPRTVLMIAYSFPPEAYVGGRRTLKYCKYLGQFGWRPIVITIKPREHAWQDEELAAQLPESVEVLRTGDIDASDWLERLARWKARRRRSAAGPLTQTGAGERPARPSLIARVKQLISRVLLHSPDPHIFWVPLACLRGARVLMTRRVDAVYSSSPPHSSHLAAALLAFCFRKPHVVDLRDPWLGSGWVKQSIIRRAARVIVVSPGEPAELAASCPAAGPNKIDVITNGFDPDDFRSVEHSEPDFARVTLTHSGTIYRETGREFFTMLERLVAARPKLRQLLRVNLIGDIDPAHADAVRRLEDAGVVHAPGCISHRDTLASLRRSDALLILARGGTSGRSHIPAKVFEYLYAGKPILAIAEDGSLTDILRNSGLGVIVPPRDAAALERTLLALCEDLRSGDLQIQPNRGYINRFDRRILTGRFAAVLDDVVSRTA